MDQASVKQRQLQETEKDMAEGACRIERQRLLMAQLQHDGHDATEARKVLMDLQSAQASLADIRNQVLMELATA